jgi:hypothetical protein
VAQGSQQPKPPQQNIFSKQQQPLPLAVTTATARANNALFMRIEFL